MALPPGSVLNVSLSERLKKHLLQVNDSICNNEKIPMSLVTSV